MTFQGQNLALFLLVPLDSGEEECDLVIKNGLTRLKIKLDED